MSQKSHLAKELSEILINISSHSGSRIVNCTALEPACFVFDTQTGWNDAKVDLFYLSLVSDMDIIVTNEEAKSSITEEHSEELLEDQSDSYK